MAVFSLLDVDWLRLTLLRNAEADENRRGALSPNNGRNLHDIAIIFLFSFLFSTHACTHASPPPIDRIAVIAARWCELARENELQFVLVPAEVPSFFKSRCEMMRADV